MFKNFSYYSKIMKKIVAVALSFTSVMTLTAVASVSNAATVQTATDSDVLKAGFVPIASDNVSHDNPFARGTANGSTTFRIPALITLQNGELLAAADARNGGVADHGGHDTVVSVSDDGGKVWYWGAALNFPDSASFSAYGTNNTSTDATTLVDPLIVQGADGKIYCTTNAVPGGISSYAGNAGAGSGLVTINGKKRLVLTNDYNQAFTMPTEDDIATYPYFVGDFYNGYAEILNRADGSATGFGIDGWFNLYYVENGVFSITSEGKVDLTQKQIDSEALVQQNVFYKNSSLHVYNTSYTLVMTSTDNARTWSAPTLLDIKRSAEENFGQLEKVTLISPGRGLLTSSGDIVMQVYNQNGRYKLNASIIYSTDNGKTWARSNDVDGYWSSENEIVELNNGVLRMFFRSEQGVICYADITKENGKYTVGAGQKTEVVVRSDCRFSAIKTSHKTELLEDIILVSAPGTPNTRNNGKIIAFALDQNNNMRVLHEYQVNEGWFAYSCLTERSDGKIALLWESGTAAFTYNVYDIDTLLGNVLVDISIDEIYTEREQCDTIKVIERPADGSIASVTSTLSTVTGYIPLYKHTSDKANSTESFSTKFDFERTLETAEFTLKASGSGWTVYNEYSNLYLTNATNASTFFTESASVMLINPTDGGSTFTVRRANNTRYVVFNPAKMVFDATVGDASTSCDYGLTLLEKQDTVSQNDTVSGYKAVTQITSGKKYLITYIFGDEVILLYPVNGLSNQTKLVGQAKDVKVNTVTVKGISNGTTTAVIDGTLYKITVHLDENENRDNMPPRIEGVLDGETYYSSQTVTVTDKYMQSVTVNGQDVTQYDVREDETVRQYTLNFDKSGYDYQTVSVSAGRNVLGVTGGTNGAKIYSRPEGVDSTGAIKWATSTQSGGIILGKSAVDASGLANSLTLTPGNRYTLEFYLKHTAGNGIALSVMGVADYGCANSLVLASKTLSATNGGWTKYSFTFKAPEKTVIGDNQYLAIVMVKPNSLANYTVLLDNLTLTEVVPGTVIGGVKNSYKLDFEKSSYDYQTIAGATGRGVLGLAGGTQGSMIYARPEGVNSTGAIKWANATSTSGIVLGKSAVDASGLKSAYELLPNRDFTVEFYIKHTLGEGIGIKLMGISDFYQTDGLVLGQKTLNTVYGEWVKYSFTFTTPEAAEIGENKYLAIMITKPDALQKYTVLLDNLSLVESAVHTAAVSTTQTLTLEGTKNETYNIVATDSSGNRTEYTVYMKSAVAELDMLDMGSIRYENRTEDGYVSAGVRYRGRVSEQLRSRAVEIGFVAVPTAFLDKMTVAQYLEMGGDKAVKAKVKADGMNEILYDVITNNQTTSYDYQLIVTGLTREGRTANLLNTKLTVTMYAVVDGVTVFGDAKSFSYNDVLAVIQK